jgi:diacylglycerol kinase family enzyme
VLPATTGAAAETLADAAVAAGTAVVVAIGGDGAAPAAAGSWCAPARG